MYMDQLDLNIDNYDLQDILDLFKLDINFNKSDLKRAYKITLHTHPDKSQLDKKYFLFFSKAFKILKYTYDFTHKEETCAREHGATGHYNSVYNVSENKTNKLLAEKIQNIPNFHKWFNDTFDKVKIRDEESDAGYNDWFTSEEDMSIDDIASPADMASAFEKKKREAKALIVHTGIQDMGSTSSGYNLVREAPTNYSSDIFSNLKYEDLKKAHTETVVPVNDDDFHNRKHFRNTDELIRHRHQNSKMLSEGETQQIYNQKQQNEQKSNINRAYKLTKQYDEIKKANKTWWGSLNLLTDRK